MNDDVKVSAEQEVAQVNWNKPHVVLLGAGASRATCPHGETNGTALPLMADFVTILGLTPLLERLGLDPTQNFEDIFSDLWTQKQIDAVKKIEAAVEAYFDKLALPETPTIYDHLVLSLREHDVITTFNWDPLLMQAYLRSQAAGLKLPRLAFLHGNIRVGYCPNDRVTGLAGRPCSHCHRIFTRTPLLYPVKEKKYAEDPFIKNEWKILTWGFENGFMITIFGYSGPKTDQEALAAMEAAWGDKNRRSMEQTALIVAPSDNEEQVRDHWDRFIHTHHYEVYKDFYDSWLANHPRRTGEAYRNQYLDAKFIEDNPIPRTLDLTGTWQWYQRFRSAESK
jgi:hypothetical protein